jgi:DeoR family transcriptional regulator, suf operon transcriptional repressor
MRNTVSDQGRTNQLPAGYRGLRGEILLEFKRSGQGLTAADLVTLLSASLNAIRHHLKDLDRDGLLARIREQRGVGAPVHVYRLSSAGENLFPKRYEALLTHLLSADSGRAAIVEAMRSRYSVLTAQLKSDLADAPTQARLDSVVRVLGEEGYMADWAETSTGLRLTEHNCAIKAVAEHFPEICETEERFLREVLGAGVERQTHILNGCSACEYSIRFPEAGPDGHPGANLAPTPGEKAEPSQQKQGTS